jgi:hypothetical protein
LKSAKEIWRRSAPFCAAAALCSVVIAVSAADTAASAGPPTASQRLQQRFTAAVDGWRKAVSKLPDQEPHEAQLVRELRVVVAPTPLPLLRVQRRLDGYTFIVSAGWLALLDELLRAEAVSDGKRDCLSRYLAKVGGALRDNRDRAAKEVPEAPHALPRLATWLESRETPEDCRKLSARLRSAAVQARADEYADTAVLWLLTRQAALLVSLPIPPAASDPGAPKDTAPASPRARATTACIWAGYAAATQTAATESAAATAALRTAVAPPDAAASSPDRRAQLALECYGYTKPAALTWLRDNAAKLFDEQTEQALYAQTLRPASGAAGTQVAR